jgi:Patatin-like phospholipase
VDRIGVALSGGGHRAALFSLGVLLYLADAGKNQSVTSVSSVSGGSLTNGYVAQSVDYAAVSGADFWQLARRPAQTIARRGTLWATPLTWAYLALLVASALLAVVGVWFLPLALALRVVLFFVALLLFAWIASARAWICARAFASTLLNVNGHRTSLADVHTTVDHVFCAADLHWGEHVYLSGRFVCAYRYGLGVPGSLSLADAVQASASYPGGFPARFFPTAPHAFKLPADERATGISRLALVDGGAYDNMADEWGLGVKDRNERWAELEPGLNELDELVVVNSSGPMDFRSLARLRLPLLGEALTLRRDVDVLYDTTTSVRRRWLYDTFRGGKTLKGAIVQVSQSPFHTAQQFAGGDDQAAERARAVLAVLGDSEAEWKARVERTRGVKTTLSRIKASDATDLVYHGYVLAMANLHVLLAHPLVPVPPLRRFSELVSGEREVSDNVIEVAST